MDNTTANTTINEENISAEVEQNSNDDALKKAIEAELERVQRRSMLVGAQTFCHITLGKIKSFESKPGKRTMADYRRLVKDIKSFCETGISRKVNADGETEPVENNTKLMEEANEGNINESNGETGSSN